jgi:hypothetical protein
MAKLYGKRINTFDELMGDTPKVEPLVKAPAVNTDAKVEQTETTEKKPIKTVPTPKFDKEQYLGGVFNQRPSAPVYNTDTERQQKAMMNAQAVGNLLALLGDVGGVAMGANVAKRNSKPLEPYMQAIQNRKDQFEKDKKIFDRQEFLDKLNFAQGKSKAAAAAEQTAYDRGRDTKADSIAAQKRKDTFEDKGNEWEYKAEQAKEGVRQFDETLAYKKAKEAADRAMKENEKRTKAEKDKTAMVANVDGKEIPILEGEKGIFQDEALEWIAKEGKSLTDMQYGFDIQPDQANEQLVRRYIADRAAKEPIFKEFILQKNNKNGITDFQEFSEKKSGGKTVSIWEEFKRKNK